MAAGFARTYGSDVLTIESAGLAPALMVSSLTRKVMLEKNIDIGDAFPKGLEMANPDEAKIWYDRARYSIVETGVAVAAEIRGREDVLAVWEYLERSLPLSTIAAAFDRKR